MPLLGPSPSTDLVSGSTQAPNTHHHDIAILISHPHTVCDRSACSFTISARVESSQQCPTIVAFHQHPHVLCQCGHTHTAQVVRVTHVFCSCMRQPTTCCWLRAGVCGDPYQHFADSSYYSRMVTPIQATYSAGSIITVQSWIHVNHGGRIGVKLCPRRDNINQACFDAFPLTRWVMHPTRLSKATARCCIRLNTHRHAPQGGHKEGSLLLRLLLRMCIIIMYTFLHTTLDC